MQWKMKNFKFPLQPIGALLRCDKNSPYRPFFRFGHSLGAATIYGLARKPENTYLWNL